MATYEFGKLKIDPKVNPSVLDTGTWDTDLATQTCKTLSEEFLKRVLELAFGSNTATNAQEKDTICYSGSVAVHEAIAYGMLSLGDGQTVFIALGDRESTILGGLFATSSVLKDKNVYFYPTSDRNVYAYTRYIHIKKGPKALGAVPRLGIGVRHSTLIWPGIFNAMYRGDFTANAIQNSLRELHLLDTLTSGTPSRVNHLFSFGPVKEGHTGSTFEGLYTQGVIESLKFPETVRFGADADHLQVKRGAEGTARTKQFLKAARYYSFYTLDVSDILDYDALTKFSSSTSTTYLEACIPNKALRSDVLWYHKKRKSLGKQFLQLDEAQIGRFVGKYWYALDAIEDLYHSIVELKNGEPFDMELSVDENPPHVRTFDTITSPAELLFLVDEIARRNLPITHIAPNFGVEKGVDYRGYDGLELFEHRIGILHKIVSEQNMMLDCHSGDDLSQNTRQIFGRATRGNIHFKISPSLQSLVGEVAERVEPDFFHFWYADTLEHTKALAADGIPFAIQALNEVRWAGEENMPSAHHAFFKEFCYKTLGDRDEQGQFIYRDKFYSLSDEFQREMDKAVEKRLLLVANDLFT